MDYFVESERIYSPKTREYFREVISSYSNGNYRSALIMLNTVCLCDLLYKLEELSDIYQDGSAKDILERVVKELKSGTKKDNWEKTLIDEVSNSTNLLDHTGKIRIGHILNYRNMSAHPAFDKNFNLISPTKEEVAACIRGALDEILIKPPVFLTDVIKSLQQEIDSKIDVYLNDYDVLSKRVRNQYLDRMPDPMLVKTFQAFWKFVFQLDNKDCTDRIEISSAIVEIVFSINPPLLSDSIKKNGNKYDVKNTRQNNVRLIKLCAKYPLIYSNLMDNIKSQINQFLSSSTSEEYKIISWFLYSSKKEMLDKLIAEKKTCGCVNEEIRDIFYQLCSDDGLSNLCLDYFIIMLAYSSSFATADYVSDSYILPYLKKFSKEQFVSIIDAINTNSQLYLNRYAGTFSRTVWGYAEHLLPADFDLTEYPNFKK